MSIIDTAQSIFDSSKTILGNFTGGSGGGSGDSASSGGTASHAIVMNPPPYSNLVADPLTTDSTNGYDGGRTYQGRWGFYSRTKPSKPAIRSVILRPMLPQSTFGLVATPDGRQHMSLKTYTGVPTNGAFAEAVNNALEMLSTGFELSGYSKTGGNPLADSSMNFTGQFGSDDPMLAFLYDSDSSVTESASSEIQDSILKSLLNFNNAAAKELNYITKGTASTDGSPAGMIRQMSSAKVPILGSINDALGSISNMFNLDKNIGETVADKVDQFMSNNPAAEDVVNAALKGYSVFFPKVWNESTFSKKYTINITLTTPYGNPQSVARNILVPFAYIMALAMPRQASASTTDSPFLIQATAQGSFSIPLGMITNISIKKGGNNDLWNLNSLMSSVTLQLEVADLYEVLPLPYKLKGKFTGSTKVYGIYDTNIRAFLYSTAGAELSSYLIDSNGVPGMTGGASVSSFGSTVGSSKNSFFGNIIKGFDFSSAFNINNISEFGNKISEQLSSSFNNVRTNPISELGNSLSKGFSL